MNRELNGEQLLEELAELRQAQVQTRALFDAAAALKELEGLPVNEAALYLQQLAQERFLSHPVVKTLLLKWAGRLKAEADVPLLVDHLERLVLTAAMVQALRRATERMGKAALGE
ncbi:MAG: hypothetical protein K1X64_17890 [Myxococcaceae bacterium]|nr:hypothetical protein [Myxococcaceae bacterium]